MVLVTKTGVRFVTVNFTCPHGQGIIPNMWSDTSLGLSVKVFFFLDECIIEVGRLGVKQVALLPVAGLAPSVKGNKRKKAKVPQRGRNSASRPQHRNSA